MDELVGKYIGDFLVQNRIGRGGMATVYRAHQESMSRDVALKVLRLTDDKTQVNDDFPERFAQEARVIASLEHIHILPVFAYGIDGDNAYLAMRLLRGGTLSTLLSRTGGPLPLDRAIDIFTQVARGLAYAHSNDILHRDLKPGNIMFDDENNVFLTDFGLAKMLRNGAASITRPDNIVGTPFYMSPEQLRGERLDARSDIYSMGVVLYQMLTGRRPFEAPSTDVIPVIYKHLEEVPASPRRVNPALPQAVAEVVMTALAKKPDERYPTIIDMANALREAVGLAPVSTNELTAISTPADRQAGGRTLLQQMIPALLLVAVVGLVLATVLLLQNDTAGPTPTPTASDFAVIEEMIGRPEQVVPTEAEIAAAQARTGEEGFVGLIACNLTSEYHATINREMTQFARAYTLPVEVYDSDTDTYTQATLIERARTDGAVGLIICPLDLELLDDTLSAIENDGVPLVMYSSGEDRYGGVVMIGDEYGLGDTSGRFAGEIVNAEYGGSARVIILDFPSLPSIVQRADGLEEGLKFVAPDAQIIGRFLGGTRESGQASIQRLLDEGVAFDFILSINDAGAFGAIEALEEAGIPPDSVIVTGVDAEAQARQYIREGYYMRGSVTVARTLSAQVMVNSMVKLLAGANVPGRVLIPAGQMVTAESLAAVEG